MEYLEMTDGVQLRQGVVSTALADIYNYGQNQWWALGRSLVGTAWGLAGKMHTSYLLRILSESYLYN